MSKSYSDIASISFKFTSDEASKSFKFTLKCNVLKSVFKRCSYRSVNGTATAWKTHKQHCHEKRICAYACSKLNPAVAMATPHTNIDITANSAQSLSVPSIHATSRRQHRNRESKIASHVSCPRENVCVQNVLMVRRCIYMPLVGFIACS